MRALGERFDRSDLFAAVLANNERHALSPLHWLEEELGSLTEAHVAVAGLTYKAGTSTIRDSLPLRLVSRLVDSGATVTGWDPAAESFDPPPRFSRSDSLQACVEGADALVVLTAHPELADVDWKDLRPARPLLVDSCLAVDRDVVEAAGWTYRGFAPS